MKEEVFITIQTFAERLDISKSKALQMARRRDLCEKGISVKINPENRNGGMRIHWQKYLEHLGVCPAVPESKRVRSKKVI